VSSLPAPGDAEQAGRGLERWLDADYSADLAAFAHRLTDYPPGRALLVAVFGNSPFLTQCCLHEAGFLRLILERGPDAVFAELLAGLDRQCRGRGDEPRANTDVLMRELRIAKRQAALLIGLTDIAGLWPLERITAALSDFADAVLGATTRHLLRNAAAAGDIALADDADVEAGTGLLILLFDADRVRYTGRTTVQQCFARLARDLFRILDERTADGYVFRADLRLRPDPAATPPAVSVEAALNYYESTGQNWERAALIKARPVAGDRVGGAAFLRELKPFLWRKHLDFAAIQDIHSIKRQINAHRGGARIAIAGHNIKLGRGGIREIEVFAQTQHLIWGGLLPELTVSRT
jgi:glutamate-ammonia-ligase adenylyltransferase